MATIGLDKLYYAKITEDDQGNETYATPTQLAKAMTADLSVELAEATLYADDGASEIVKEFKSGTLSLGVDDLGGSVASDLTGATIDNNGVVVSTAEDGGTPVAIGEAVGVIAAQSIGEPGTQLTMRTFHTGGVAGGDITQGLPRVEELFEARKPKGLAIIAEFGGVVSIKDSKKKREVVITNSETGEAKAYLIPYGSRIKVYDGQVLEAGDELTEGSVNPHDIVRVKGIGGVQEYIVKEVQRVYRMQGVDVNDKHIEVIVRQMLSKVKVEDPGDTELIPGGYEDVLTFDKCNEEAIAQGLKPAVAKRVLLGITKASLATESFLSAASFQETTRVLTEAAIKGKEDHLIGLKENVIIGKLIPAGTGMKRYKNIAVQKIEE